MEVLYGLLFLLLSAIHCISADIDINLHPDRWAATVEQTKDVYVMFHNPSNAFSASFRLEYLRVSQSLYEQGKTFSQSIVLL